jgi:hypothetical protein
LENINTLLQRLPTRDAVVLYVDFAALRRAGLLKLLSPGTMSAEPEYQSFIRKTEFDYQDDLDLAVGAFAPQGKYFFLKGRFDWQRLQKYAEDEGGACPNLVCDMTGSTPDRKISFFPARPDMMAMAVSPSDGAATVLQTDSRESRPVEPARDPVWLSLPPSTLRSGEHLPPGTRMFASTLENVQNVTLSMGPDGRRFALRMNARCRSAQEAVTLSVQLVKVTNMLREMIARENQKPNPSDLSGVLTAGAFRQQGSHVFGYWPVESSFLQALLSGGE